MKEFDVRVQSLIYQITTLSKLEAEKAEKKLLYDYLAAVMQELPEEPKAPGAHAGRNGTHGEGFRAEKERVDG